ncbi:hypothetical protein MNBD_PLANCTO02-1101 [hydrothermal vent metagenome]|uniref:HPt domain-containing protein n=1 Tax=hydrothermal vent metagenome TaxID=652676 RepID=A0A3B1DDX2_9ZZZZ
MQNQEITLDNTPIYSDFAEDEDFAELIEFYVSTINDKKEEIRTLFQSGDLQELKIKAHQMKGSAGGYGFSDLSELGGELEQACRSEEIVIVAEKVAAILRYLDRISL